MNRIKSIILTVSLVLATTLIFSCSSDIDDIDKANGNSSSAGQGHVVELSSSSEWTDVILSSSSAPQSSSSLAQSSSSFEEWLSSSSIRDEDCSQAAAAAGLCKLPDVSSSGGQSSSSRAQSSSSQVPSSSSQGQSSSSPNQSSSSSQTQSNSSSSQGQGQLSSSSLGSDGGLKFYSNVTVKKAMEDGKWFDGKDYKVGEVMDKLPVYTHNGEYPWGDTLYVELPNGIRLRHLAAVRGSVEDVRGVDLCLESGALRFASVDGKLTWFSQRLTDDICDNRF
jgi:hypothetical protein